MQKDKFKKFLKLFIDIFKYVFGFFLLVIFCLFLFLCGYIKGYTDKANDYEFLFNDEPKKSLIDKKNLQSTNRYNLELGSYSINVGELYNSADDLYLGSLFVNIDVSVVLDFIPSTTSNNNYFIRIYYFSLTSNFVVYNAMNNDISYFDFADGQFSSTSSSSIFNVNARGSSSYVDLTRQINNYIFNFQRVNDTFEMYFSFDNNSTNVLGSNFNVDFETYLEDYEFTYIINDFQNSFSYNFNTSFLFDLAGINFSNGYEIGDENGYTVGFDDGIDFGYNQGYLDGYEIGYDDAIVNESTIGDMLLSIADIPFQILSDFIGFEILGFNLLTFITGLLGLFLAIFLFKKLT